MPQIEGLTVEEMLEFGKARPLVARHLPDERDWDHMDRKWLSDVLYTTAKADFDKMIKDAVKARKERLEEKNSLNVHMRPEFALAFQNCMNFSGKSFPRSPKLNSGELEGIEPAESLLKEEEDQGGARGGEARGGAALG